MLLQGQRKDCFNSKIKPFLSITITAFTYLALVALRLSWMAVSSQVLASGGVSTGNGVLRILFRIFRHYGFTTRVTSIGTAIDYFAGTVDYT